MEVSPMKPIVIRRPRIEEVTGLSYSTVARLERAGRFPKRRQLAGGSAGWLFADLEAWAAALPVSQLGLRGEKPKPAG
jgi:prophage regulatory protein